MFVEPVARQVKRRVYFYKMTPYADGKHRDFVRARRKAHTKKTNAKSQKKKSDKIIFLVKVFRRILI